MVCCFTIWVFSYRFRCKCDAGYVQNANKTACQDINECSRNNGGCEHICQNIPGKYKCRCKPGFEAVPAGWVTKYDDECTLFRDFDFPSKDGGNNKSTHVTVKNSSGIMACTYKTYNRIYFHALLPPPRQSQDGPDYIVFPNNVLNPQFPSKYLILIWKWIWTGLTEQFAFSIIISDRSFVEI